VEVEEVGFTLDDYLAAKQAKSQGLLKKGEVRQEKEKISGKIEESKGQHSEMATTLTKNLDAGQLYVVGKGQGAELLGFGAV
jgi:hypothetical protein